MEEKGKKILISSFSKVNLLFDVFFYHYNCLADTSEARLYVDVVEQWKNLHDISADSQTHPRRRQLVVTLAN